MPQRTVQILPTVRRELPWFSLMALALLGTFVLSHFVIRRGIVLPSLAAGGSAPPWVWASLYAPELIALLMVGWRLRSWVLVGLYAGGATALREGFHLALRFSGGGADHSRFASAGTELAIALPITLAAYAIVFAAASATGQDESAANGA